jgi:predicted DNA-binding protein (UPF0251 family)
VDRRDQDRALADLARALNELDTAQRHVDLALVEAVKLRCGARAQRIMELSYATFWRRVKRAREAVIS